MKPITTDTYTFSDLIDRADGRRITLIGMGFSSNERTVTDWQVDQM